jgi:hypothetical protein
MVQALRNLGRERGSEGKRAVDYLIYGFFVYPQRCGGPNEFDQFIRLSGQIFMKYSVGEFYGNLLSRFQFLFRSDTCNCCFTLGV